MDGLPVLKARGLDPGAAVAVADGLAVALFYLIWGNKVPLAVVPLVSGVLDDA